MVSHNPLTPHVNQVLQPLPNPCQNDIFRMKSRVAQQFVNLWTKTSHHSPNFMETRNPKELSGSLSPSESHRFALYTDCPCSEVSKSSLKLHHQLLLTIPPPPGQLLLFISPIDSWPFYWPQALLLFIYSWKNKMLLWKRLNGETPLCLVQQHPWLWFLLPCPRPISAPALVLATHNTAWFTVSRSWSSWKLLLFSARNS